jgi:diguanylate cyclase (GGDEF)-like protein
MKIETDIDELIQLVSTATEAYTTAFFLADNHRRMLKLWRFYSLGDNVITDASIPFGVGPIGLVAENLEQFDLTKFSERDSSLLRLYSKNEGIKSFFAVPVMRENILEGVLCIDSKKAFVFANKDQKLLTLFAKQFADLVNNVRVKQFVDTEASDIAFLHGICRKIVSANNARSILDLMMRSIEHLVECDSHFISLKMEGEEGIFRVELAHSPRNMHGTTFSDQDGLAGRVIRGREPLLLANRKDDLGSYVFTYSESVGRVRSFLGLPLLTGDDVLGLTCLVDSAENSFNQRDLRVLSIISDNASTAITNLRTRREVRGLKTTVDGLTGLHNFSGFQECLKIAFQDADPKRRPLSLIIMDIDDLKEINNLNYRTGNKVLRRIAQLLMNLNRNNGISPARLGSDEFALILPGITMDRAALIAEEIHREVGDPTFITSDYGTRNISISVGISSFSYDCKSCGDLMDNALRALSLARSRGGDRVVCYNARYAGVRL